MDKSIKQHQEFISKNIESISKSNTSKLNIKKKLKNLEKYNRSTILNFQHERQIHLLVTLFFALLTIIFAMSVFILGYITSNNPDFQTTLVLAMAILAILLTTEIFYVIHYFKLENGTQSLYRLSHKIFDLINEIDSN
jgi:hypothetical protein